MDGHSPSSTRASALAHEIGELRLVDTHEHLGLSARRLVRGETAPGPASAEADWLEARPDVLEDLFGLHPYYALSDLVVAGAAPEAVERLLDPSAGDLESRFAGVRDAWELIEHTGYGETVRLVASEVYGLDGLTPEGLEQGQARLDGLQRPGETLRLLSDAARLDHVQIDDQLRACRPDPAGADFFLYDLSWWAFCRGAIETEEILDETGIEVATLADLRAAMAAIFDRYAPCSIAVKSQHAYQRTLRWEERSDDDAARALAAILRGGAVDETARLVLGDWCWARGVELAIDHDLPFKLHTGYHAGHSLMPVDWIRAGNLCGLLQSYPEARFVLMHAGYPYGDELVAIAKHYPNVWVDMCWAWSIDPYSSLEFVRRFLHAVPVSKLFAFGGDSFSPTNAVAYARQLRRWLTRALEAEVAAGDLTEEEAIAVAHRVMRENQYACFDIEGTRSALRSASTSY